MDRVPPKERTSFAHFFGKQSDKQQITVEQFKELCYEHAQVSNTSGVYLVWSNIEKLVAAINAASGEQPADERKDASNPDELDPPELLASRLIDAWCDAHGRLIPWAKAIEITAIVTKMPEAEKQRLLSLDDDVAEKGERND